MLKGIVFDLDGTLVDSLGATLAGFNHAITAMGSRPHTPEEIMQHFGTGEDQIFSKILGREKAQAAYDLFRTYMNDHMGKVPLHAGVQELLDQIRRDQVPTAIFTGRSWDTTEIILRHHGILERFITVVANDHVDFPKPSPAGLHLALTRMKLSANEVLFIGDSPADMIASQAAGSHGVAALWDLLADRTALAAHQPAHWAHHPSEIWDIWKKQQ
jgi:phosphoglycolate phosphatase